jgi:hypothetical protein
VTLDELLVVMVSVLLVYVGSVGVLWGPLGRCGGSNCHRCQDGGWCKTFVAAMRDAFHLFWFAHDVSHSRDL